VPPQGRESSAAALYVPILGPLASIREGHAPTRFYSDTGTQAGRGMHRLRAPPRRGTLSPSRQNRRSRGFGIWAPVREPALRTSEWSACSASDVGGHDVGGVAIEGDPGPVVAHRGPWVGV
jgi:hypothetical protein